MKLMPTSIIGRLSLGLMLILFGAILGGYGVYKFAPPVIYQHNNETTVKVDKNKRGSEIIVAPNQTQKDTIQNKRWFRFRQ